MKYLAPLLITIAVCSAGVVKDPTLGYREGDRYFYFPGEGEDEYHLVDSWESADEEFINEYARNPANNVYLLFTRTNPTASQQLVVGNADSVLNSNFDSNKETVFLAHGWNGNANSGMNTMLTAALLEDNDVNVIVLDWNRMANRNYVTAKRGVPAVGRGLGEFIVWLTTLGLQFDKTHLIGFSLGGHLVGAAGRATGGQVRRITSLDPAGPLWSYDSSRIAKTDGQYVEVIHTNTAFLGYSGLCGDADFYPNGGSSMPGCWTNNCSHGRAVEYMLSSIRYNHFHANECDTLRDATRGRCSGSLNPMGNSDINKSRAGIFRVDTDRRYPF